MFIIEDERHAEWQDGRFETRADAIEELRRRASIPWNESPNCAPCTSWKTCGRHYIVIEFDTSSEPWQSLSEESVMTIDAGGVHWHLNQSTESEP